MSHRNYNVHVAFHFQPATRHDGPRSLRRGPWTFGCRGVNEGKLFTQGLESEGKTRATRNGAHQSVYHFSDDVSYVDGIFDGILMIISMVFDGIFGIWWYFDDYFDGIWWYFWYLMVFLMIISMVFDGIWWYFDGIFDGIYLMVFLMVIDGDDPIFPPSSNFSMPRGFRFVHPGGEAWEQFQGLRGPLRLGRWSLSDLT